MLVPLLVAASLLAQAPLFAAHAPQSSPKTSLSFTINIPAIPSFQSDTLTLTRNRRLMPLSATLTFDEHAEEIQEEEDLVTAINSERTSRGLDPLVQDTLLCEAARAHCREMCALHYFAHRSPTPIVATPIDRYLDELRVFNEKRPAGALVGENIFYASVTNDLYNTGYAHQRLMESPSHRENILEPRFTKVGVGLYRDAQGRFWITEMFLRDS